MSGCATRSNVAQDGWYSITTLYTSKFGGHISLDVNGVDATGPLDDPVDLRDGGHGGVAAGAPLEPDLRTRPLPSPRGKQLLTLHFLDQPVMNFDYMEFVKSAAP